jgi:hypothetical protein
MRFDILSNRPAAERAMREDLLKRKYKVKEERARAAVITAEAGARTGEQRFGPSGLVGEELERRYPKGLPGMEAETARISATGYATSARRGAATAEKRLGLEREKFEFGKEFVGAAGGMPGSPEAETGEVARIRKKLSADICPEGFTWDGQQCVPTE